MPTPTKAKVAAVNAERLARARDRDRRLQHHTELLGRHQAPDLDTEQRRRLAADIRSLMAERTAAVAEANQAHARAGQLWHRLNTMTDTAYRLVTAGNRLASVARANGRGPLVADWDTAAAELPDRISPEPYGGRAAPGPKPWNSRR